MDASTGSAFLKARLAEAAAVTAVHDGAQAVRPKATRRAFTGKQNEFINWCEKMYPGQPSA